MHDGEGVTKIMDAQPAEQEKVKQSPLCLALVWVSAVTFLIISFGQGYFALQTIWEIFFPIFSVALGGAILTSNKSHMPMINKIFMWLYGLVTVAIFSSFFSYDYLKIISQDLFITITATLIGLTAALFLANFIYRLIKC